MRTDYEIARSRYVQKLLALQLALKIEMLKAVHTTPLLGMQDVALLSKGRLPSHIWTRFPEIAEMHSVYMDVQAALKDAVK
jgi:hypothetical protein